jgi:carbon storage regulator
MDISCGPFNTERREKRRRMLVLMRRPGESIHIGPNIVVTLVALERNRARIGIEAPRDVAIDREEIAEKKRLEALIELEDPEQPESEPKSE